jgi:peptidoglycan/xylan/chitin deacetylase (PgdA/CDA1 family)
MSQRWVCLMYHDVTSGSAPASRSAGYFSVDQAVFGAQLDQLAAEGYAVRSLEATLADPRPRQVAVTFDDGDLGQCELGFPELARRGMSATFFVTTNWVGQPGYASWAKLREMRAAGMSIQSHTRSHPFLSELAPGMVEDELRGSREALNEALDQQTTSLALPNGDFPRGGPRVFQEAGYRVVATSRWGRNGASRPAAGEIEQICRCTIRGRPAEKEFRDTAAGDPWLAARHRLRESTLNAFRSAIGPTRYAGWRRRFLDLAGRQGQ